MAEQKFNNKGQRWIHSSQIQSLRSDGSKRLKSPAPKSFALKYLKKLLADWEANNEPS